MSAAALRRRVIVPLAMSAALCAGVLAWSPAARAQDDHAAGLFCDARQLPLVSQSVRVVVRGPDAELLLEQTFVNDGPDVAQADYRVPLPQGATVVGFGFFRDGALYEAKLMEKEHAKAAHAAAADAGRTTGFADSTVSMARFSVFPVHAGARQRVQLRLQVPVSAEAGRNHVRVPVDSFLGQRGPSSTILLDLKAAAAVDDVGADGAALAVLSRSSTSVLAAAAARHPVDLWWGERGAPLVVRATSTALGDGAGGATTAVEIVARLNDAAALLREGAAARKRSAPLTVLVDGSASMSPKSRALELALRRMTAKSGTRFVVVGDRTLPAFADADAALRAVLDHDAGFGSTWTAMAAAAARLRCDAEDVRCVAIVDAQIEPIADAVKSEIPTLVLASSDEGEWRGDALTRHALLGRVDVDPDARFLALADEMTLPVLTVTGVDGGAIPWKQSRQAAEGGMVRLLATAEQAPKTLHVTMLVDGKPIERAVPVAVAAADDDEGRRVRRATWELLLAEQVAALRKQEDPTLRQRIIDLSVREGIPTELTALQVDVPAPPPSFVGGSAPEPATWAALLLVIAVALFTWRRATA